MRELIAAVIEKTGGITAVELFNFIGAMQRTGAIDRRPPITQEHVDDYLEDLVEAGRIRADLDDAYWFIPVTEAAVEDRQLCLF